MPLSIRRAKARAEQLRDALEVDETRDVSDFERTLNFKKRSDDLVPGPVWHQFQVQAATIEQPHWPIAMFGVLDGHRREFFGVRGHGGIVSVRGTNAPRCPRSCPQMPRLQAVYNGLQRTPGNKKAPKKGLLSWYRGPLRTAAVSFVVPEVGLEPTRF